MSTTTALLSTSVILGSPSTPSDSHVSLALVSPPLDASVVSGQRKTRNSNGSRNSGRRKQYHDTQRPSSSPTPSADSSRSTRKTRKNYRKSTTRGNSVNASIKPSTPSPSAVSRCSMVSIATTSSGLSSAASSMRTLNDPHPLTDPGSDSVIKSSSSSAASSAGFCDMASNDDVDEDDFSERFRLSTFFDDSSFIDPFAPNHYVYSRQWSCPQAKPQKPKRNRRQQSSQQYPNLSNPAIKQYFNEQRTFYRKIYDQQFAVLSTIKLATTPSEHQTPEPRQHLYVAHQHLGLPPLPPPIGAPPPWVFSDPSGFTSLHQPDIPNPCEEAFFNRIKLHAIPKIKKMDTAKVPNMTQVPSRQAIVQSKIAQPPLAPQHPQPDKTTEQAPVEPHCIAARARFQMQIRERALGSNEIVTSSSYASVIGTFATKCKIEATPTPLNAISLPPMPTSSSIASCVNEKTSVIRTKKNNKKSQNLSQRGSRKAVTKEFCMQENDFPPISKMSTAPMKEVSPSSSTKGESGYTSELSANCSTADCEVESHYCESTTIRNYSAVVANKALKTDSETEVISLLETSLLSEDTAARYDVLTEQICDVYERATQTEATLVKKLRLRDMLYYQLSTIFPVCGLYIVGSSLNGFGNENSDMDLCLIITTCELNQRTDAVQVLKMVENTLTALSVVREQHLIPAKVPILRIKFKGAFKDFTVDLNANNSVAIRNTHLLCYYAFFDWRLRPLTAIVKEWAKRCNINDASRSSFTSYSLVLMVIHYLQVGAERPVLPSLQQLFPRRFSTKNDIRTLNVSIPLEDIPPGSNFERNEDATLGELLIGFFHYYASVYDFEKDAISVRLGHKVDRKAVIKNGSQWSPICIEEPFTSLNTAHSVYDERVFQAIKLKFREAYDILNRTADIKELLSVSPHNVPIMPYYPKTLST